WEVRVGLPVPPDHLDLWINSLRNDFAGQLTTHIRIEGVDALSDLVRVLRHRLPPFLGKAFGGSTGLVDVVIARRSHDQALLPNGDNRNAKLNSTGAAHRTAARAAHD